MICNVMYCNAEGYFKIMRHYRNPGKNSKPFCKDIMRYCEIHARMIAKEDTDVRIQVLS
jgi:hypothetical protein